MSLTKEGRLRIPVVEWLASRSMTPVFECIQSIDIVGVEWGPRVGRFVPPINLLCAVELKLHDLAGVLHQAHTNRYRCHECWIAMPKARVEKFKSCTVQKIREMGVGLLSVDGEARVICQAVRKTIEVPHNVHRSLWRRRTEFINRMATQRAIETALVQVLA